MKILLIGTFLLGLIGCGSDTTSQNTNQDTSATTLNVLAGSEIKDLAENSELMNDLRAKTGIDLKFTYTGTIEGIDKIENGQEQPDIAWFAQDKYFHLMDTKHLIKESTKTMISPVVLGVKTSVAKSLGWKDGKTTWKDVEKAVSNKNFRYAMTSPTTSNSGFSAVVGITTAFSGNGNAAKTKDVDNARLSSFFKGQKIFSGSSGWLADAYVKNESTVDGIINYESIILGLKDRADKPSQPLTVIAPKDGTVIADYPMVLINSDKKTSYDKVLTWIKSNEIQTKIMNETHRRPILSSIRLASEFNTSLLIDTPFPGSKNTIDAMLLAYLNQHRVAGHSIFVLDKTGSMSETDGTDKQRIQRVRDGLYVLTGSDLSTTGKFAKFDNREKITIETFSEQPEIVKTFTMKSANDQNVFTGIRQIADNIQPDGNTAIYDALETALDEASKDTSGRYVSIVLMTDGESNHGETAQEFLNKYHQRNKHVHIFTIGIGDSKSEELTKISEETGGKYFDGRKEDLSNVFKTIRGYQ